MIWKLSERKDWNSLEQQFGWVRDMNQVPQHTVHHAEGSVAVHTRMVLAAAPTVRCTAPNLSGQYALLTRSLHSDCRSAS